MDDQEPGPRPRIEKFKVRHSPDVKPEPWARFVELKPFSRKWSKLRLDDVDRQALQLAIMASPDSPVVPGTGGLRKIRFTGRRWGRGKSGAARVCYAYYREYAVVFLITVYSKNEKEDLSASEKSQIKALLREIESALRAGQVRL